MSAKTRVLRRLTEGPATTADLCQPEVGGRNFPARVEELRKESHDIRSERVSKSSWRYTLEVGSSAEGRGQAVRPTGRLNSRPADATPGVAPSFDPTEGGRWEVRHVEPLPSQAHEWEHVLRFTPGEITAEYWRRAADTQGVLAVAA